MRICPRDKRLLRAATIGEASVDVCGKCGGTFFDSEDLIGAAGVPADPSTWDRAESGGNVKPSELACPECETSMDAQDVTHDDKKVEIDRCGKCRGIWLDKGELDTLAAIGEKLMPLVEAARAKAQKEIEALDKDGVDFRGRTPREKKKLYASLGLLALAVAGIAAYVYDESKSGPIPAQNRDNVEGCPCGCDRSKAMAAEVRAKEDVAALASIESTLVTIGQREDAGYVTERMVQHRLRMLDVAEEIFDRQPRSPGPFPELDRLSAGRPASRPSRCASPRVAKDGLRACPELAVHGERIEIVKGEEKLIGSSFRLWLEIENLGDEPRALAPPAIQASHAPMPVTRWYREGGAGQPWDGRIAQRETVRVDVIGDIPERVMPGTPIDAAIAVGPLAMRVQTQARAVIHFTDR